MIKILNIFYHLIHKNKQIERFLRKKINDLLDLKENFFNPYPRNLLEIKNKKIKNILLFSHGYTGDIAIFSSFTSYLRKKYKNAKIKNIILNKDSIKYIASLDKNIDEIIPIRMPRFFNFNYIKKIKKKYKYDLFIYLNIYPDLRFLMPNIKLIHIPYFVFRNIPFVILRYVV